MIRSHSIRVAAGVVVALLALASMAHADMSAIRIDQIGWADRAGDANTQFVQLVATAPGQTRDAELHLEVTSALGSVSDLLVTFGPEEGGPWPEQGAWLLGGTSFTSKVGLARDGAMAKIDASAGTLTLWTYDAEGNRVDLDSFTWSRESGVPRSPYSGQSLQRVPYGFTTLRHPRIVNSTGANVIDTGYGYEPQLMWTIDEAFFDCATGTANARYVQFHSTAAGAFDPNLLVRARDSQAHLLGQQRLFPALTNSSFTADTYWLMSTSAFQAATGLIADGTLTNPPSATAGTLELLLSNAAGDTLTSISQLSYGTAAGSTPVPAKGLALHRQPDGSYQSALAAPVNRARQSVQFGLCFGAPVAGLAWHVREFGMDCGDHVPGLWFAELTPDFAQPADSRLALRILDHNGGTIVDIPSLNADPTRPALLLASASFASITGFAPDRIVTGTPDPVGGRVQLYMLANGSVSVVQDLRYGSDVSPNAPLPPAGGSVRFGTTSYAVQARATPTRSDGAIAQSDCFNAYTAAGLLLEEVGLRCALGEPNTEFIELRALSGPLAIDGRLGMRIFDHQGTALGDLRPWFGSRPALLTGAQRYLIGGAGLAAIGLTPDLVLPFGLDHEGGRLQLYRVRVDSTQEALGEVAYGSLGVSVPDGNSLTRQSSGTYAVTAAPTPTNAAGAVLAANVCYGPPAGVSYDIDEFGIGCREAGPGIWFLAIHPRFPNPVTDPRLTLRAFDHTGLLRFQRNGLGAHSLSGDFLIASPGFVAATGFTPDFTLAGDVDPLGGRIELAFSYAGRDSIVSRLRYGSGGDVAAPANGGSVRATATGFVAQSVATPARSDGAVATGSCFSGTTSASLRIGQLGLRCRAGTPSRSYVELTAFGAAAMLDPNLHLEWFDARDARIGDLSSTFAGSLALAIPAGKSLLIAPASLASAGIAPDLILPFTPDTTGGRVLLTRHRLDGVIDTLSEVRYGTQGLFVSPGWSLVLDTDGSYHESPAPPTNLTGVIASGSSCFGGSGASPWQIEALATRCTDGSAASFVQLRVLGSTVATSDLGMLVQDSTSRTIADMPGILSPIEGRRLSSGLRLLIASAAFAQQQGGHADIVLPVELDATSGAVVLYVDPLGDVSHRTWITSLRYGPNNAPIPPPGMAVTQTSTGIASLVRHPQPTDSTGALRLTPCYERPDTSVRIAELGIRCGTGGSPGYGYVSLSSLDPRAIVQSGLGVRMYDAAGQLRDDHPLREPGVIGAAWADFQDYGYGYVQIDPKNVLLATPACEASIGTADEHLAAGPDPDSGAVELYFRDSFTGGITVLDRWVYGVPGALPAPQAGIALRRAGTGIVFLTASQLPFGLKRTQSQSACTHPIQGAPRIEQVLLQCADGSLAEQSIELRTSSAIAFDPFYGLDVLDSSGRTIFDATDLFHGREWRSFPAGTSFLLKTAAAAGAAGLSPDYTLPAALDTSGGAVRLYHVDSNGSRRIVSRVDWGGGAPLPPPGSVIVAAGSTADLLHPTFRRFPTQTWPDHGCLWAPPAMVVSEIAAACGYEPLDASGEFVELRADSASTLTGLFALLVKSSRGSRSLPLFTGAAAGTLAKGQNWLIAAPGFAAANGVTADETLLDATTVGTSLTATLTWTPGARYSPVTLGSLGIGVGGAPNVGYGSSVARTAGGALVAMTIPDPRNSIGDGISATDACLGNGALANAPFVDGISSGSALGGAASAFVQLHYSDAANTGSLRIRITGRDGATVADVGDLFGGVQVNAPTPPSSGYDWLVGAVGFSGAAKMAANIERAIAFDPLGGQVVLYRHQNSGPDVVTSRFDYPALAPGQGLRRTPVVFPLGTWNPPAPAFPGTQGIDWTHSWSSYGEYHAMNVSFNAAGNVCPNGTTTTSFIDLGIYTLTYCDGGELGCFSFYYPPRGGWIRSLDAQGAILDSVALYSPTIAPNPAPSFSLNLSHYAYSSADIVALGGPSIANHPPRMDPQGGTLQFMMMDPTGRTVGVSSQRSYGTAAGAPPPTGAFFSTIGRPAMDYCGPCGVHLFRPLSPFEGPTLRTTAPLFDTDESLDAAHRARFRFKVDGAQGSTSITNMDATPLMAMTSVNFNWSGGASSSATITAKLVVKGGLHHSHFDGARGLFNVLASIDGDDPQWASKTWLGSTDPSDTMIVADTLVLPIRVSQNRPFRLGTSFTSMSEPYRSLGLETKWLFSDLPPGSVVTSCHGYGGAPVPTSLALANAQAFDDRIELEWMGGEPNTRYTLERQSVGDGAALSPWLPLATVLADGGQHVSYRDGAVRGGATYAYRLRGSDGSLTAETRVSVPDPARLSLAIVGAQPVHGALEFAITRPGAAAANLELFDIAGRLVAHREFAAGGEIRAQCKLDTGTARAGVFLARLRCAGDQRIVRVVRTP